MISGCGGNHTGIYIFTQELNEGNKIILHSWGRGSILYIGRYRGLLKKTNLLHCYICILTFLFEFDIKTFLSIVFFDDR